MIEYIFAVACFNTVATLGAFKEQIDIKWQENNWRKKSFLPDWCTLCIIFWVSIFQSIFYSIFYTYFGPGLIPMPFIITAISLLLLKQIDSWK